MLFSVLIFLFGLMCFTISGGKIIGVFIIITSLIIGFLLKMGNTMVKDEYEKILNEKLTKKEYEELKKMFHTFSISNKNINSILNIPEDKLNLKSRRFKIIYENMRQKQFEHDNREFLK